LKKRASPLLLFALLTAFPGLCAQETASSAIVGDLPIQDQTQKPGETKPGQARAESQGLAPAVQPHVIDLFSRGQLPMRPNTGPLSVTRKFAYCEKPVFGPRRLFIDAAAAGLFMAHPTSDYPPEWRDGAGAFGRNFGNQLARSAASSSARFSLDTLLREDPRYWRSGGNSFFARTAYALGFTFIDRTDSGRPTIALGNFAGAVASGFVGNAYLPDGWTNATHAGQRSLAALGALAAQNLVQEFLPEIGAGLDRHHLPRLPLPPVWWGREP